MLALKTVLRVVLLLFVIVSCEKTESNIQNDSLVFEYNQIEESKLASNSYYINPETQLSYTGWGVYEDIIFPGSSIYWKMEHQSIDNKNSLAIGITGGDAYNNVFFTNTVALAWKEVAWPYRNVSKLIYQLDFYLPNAFDCNSPNNAILEGIEFTFQHLLIPYSYGFGLQYAKSGEWRFWNDEKNPETNKPFAWQSFSPKIITCLASNQWHTIQIIGFVKNHKVYYEKMTLDNTTYNLNSAVINPVPSPQGWVENFLQVGVQLNGNKSIQYPNSNQVDPIEIYIDKVSLKGYATNQ
jgi:hypothetical protein